MTLNLAARFARAIGEPGIVPLMNIWRDARSLNRDHAAAVEQLALHQQGFRHDNTYSARAHKFGNGGQQVDGEYE